MVQVVVISPENAAYPKDRLATWFPSPMEGYAGDFAQREGADCDLPGAGVGRDEYAEGMESSYPATPAITGLYVRSTYRVGDEGTANQRNLLVAGLASERVFSILNQAGKWKKWFILSRGVTFREKAW